MNVVMFFCGFGNQMFQYAFYKKLKLMGKDVRADISWFESPKADRVFSLKDAFPDIELDTQGAKEELQRVDAAIRNRPIWLKAFQYVFRNSRAYVGDGHGQTFNPIYLRMEGRCFGGYWQSEKYWLDEKEEILNSFTFREIQNKRFRQIEEICSGQNTISLHVRRGDFLTAGELYTNICTEDYYNSAIAYMKAKNPDARFVIFSDDVQWVKENWNQSDWIYASDYLDADIPDWAEMKLMSLCQHNIIANSTFSWWGAYLNRNPKKIVISPKIWHNHVETPDIWPQGWLKM